jgi:uncharacterized membrane protein HdeD (DUF308 family)
MLTVITRWWWLYALRGIIGILFGMAALAWTDITLEVLVVLFGAFVLADGIFAFATAVTDGLGLYGVWVMLEGITEIAVGIVTLVWPNITTFVLLYLIAACAIISGLFRVLAAIRLRKELASAGWLVLSGVLSMVVGVVFALHPTSGALALVWLMGVFAILCGIPLLVLAFRLRYAGIRIGRIIEGD